MIQHLTKIASGPGAAHSSFGMFGARGPLLNGLDAGGGGTGGGTNGTTVAPPAQQPVTPPAEQPRLFTQEEVNTLVGRARVEAREGTKKPAPAPQSSNDGGGDERLSLKALQQRLDDSETRRNFDRRALKLGLEDDAADDLFDLFRSQRPDDVGAWFDAKVKRLGLKTSGTTTTTITNPQQATGTTPAQLAPQTPPLSNKGAPAPSDVRDHERALSDNPIGFGGVDYERLVAKHGEAKARELWMEAAKQKAGSIKVTFK